MNLDKPCRILLRTNIQKFLSCIVNTFNDFKKDCLSMWSNEQCTYHIQSRFLEAAASFLLLIFCGLNLPPAANHSSSQARPRPRPRSLIALLPLLHLVPAGVATYTLSFQGRGGGLGQRFRDFRCPAVAH